MRSGVALAGRRRLRDTLGHCCVAMTVQVTRPSVDLTLVTHLDPLDGLGSTAGCVGSESAGVAYLAH